MPKVSALPPMTILSSDDETPVVDKSASSTKKKTPSIEAEYFFEQTNQPTTGTGSPIQRAVDDYADCIISGGIWSPDSVGVNRNASMTALVVRINGRRISIGAVTARTFTASKDTYIDVLDNGDGTGTLVYTEVTNGATTGFTLAANSLRLGSIVTGATTIASTASLNQFGQDAMGYIHFPKSARLKQLNQCHLASGTTAISGSATSIANASATNYVFNEAGEELFDPSNMHSTSTNPERITVEYPGLYEVVCNVFWPDSAVGQRILDVSRSGAGTIASCRNGQDGAGRSAQQATSTVFMRKNDYIQASVYQNTGGSLAPTFVNLSLKLIA